MTRDEIIQRWPRASESFIQANIGNGAGTMNASTAMANAYEQLQRQKQPAPIIAPVEKVSAVPPQASTSKAWVTIGGKRFYAKSLWEQNYAHYLECLKQQGSLMDWEYEPETFWFEGIRRGTNNYKPDFRITHNDGSIEYREVKGYMDPKSKTKIRRMAKYHPDVRLRVLGKKWWKKHGVGLSRVIPGWRKGK